MADKKTSVDVTELAAAVARKTGNQYRVETFRNQNDSEAEGFSAALIDQGTGSVTLQANAGSVEDATQKLGEAVADGNVVFLDPAVAPAVETQDVPEAATNPKNDKQKEEARQTNFRRAAVVRENAEATRRAGDLDNGYRAVRTGDATDASVEESVSVSVKADTVPVELKKEAEASKKVKETTQG